MPDLTAQQAAFVEHYTSTPGCIGNGAASVRAAGYGAKHQAEIARQLLDKPHVRAALDAANRQAVSGRLYAKAVALLERVLEDEDVSMKVRVDAAKVVLARAEGAIVPAGRIGPAPFGQTGADAQTSEDVEASRAVVAEMLAKAGLRMVPDGSERAGDTSKVQAAAMRLVALPAGGVAEYTDK